MSPRAWRRALSRAGLAVLLLGTAAGCAEDSYRTSLRGEWRFRSPDTGASGTVVLPADLTAAAGLSNRAGSVVLERELPAGIGELLARGRPVAFNAGSVSDVFEIVLNGVSAGGRGRVDPYEPGYFRTFVADLPALPPAGARESATHTLSIRIYTNGQYPVYVYGPALSIGESRAVYAEYYRGEALIFMLLAMYGFIAFYHLLLALRRPAELHNLYFGLFTLATAAYWFFGTELRGIVFGAAVLTPMMIEHVLLYNLGTLFLLFLSQLFYKRHSRVALVLGAVLLLCSATALLAPFAIKRMVLLAFQASLVLLIPYVVWYTVRAYRAGRPDAGFLVCGVVLFLLAALHDVFVLAQLFETIAQALPALPEYRPAGPIASYVFLLVIFGVAAMLANRFARVHTEAERLNVELEDRVRERTAELRAARRETDDILATVQEGLFLLYRSAGEAESESVFLIGQQHSRQLAHILATDSALLSGRDFLGLLRPMLEATEAHRAHGAGASESVPGPPIDAADVLAGTRKYLDLMFAGRLPAKTLNKLNPLAGIRLCPGPESELERDLQFRFYRLQSGADANPGQLMAVVVDVTEQEELARRLIAEQEKSEAERARLFAVLQCEPRELAGFIADAATELERAQNALAARDRDRLFRAAHALKGDAGMLDLGFFADRAHECEALIELWQPDAGPQVSEEIARRLSGLSAVLDAIRGDLERMHSFQMAVLSAKASGADADSSFNSAGNSGRSDLDAMVRGLERLAERVADRQGKAEVCALDASGLRSAAARALWERLPHSVHPVVRDALIQLVRNSVVHGIEPNSADRVAAGKAPMGQIRLSLTEASGQAVFSLRDDGRGLDLAGLRARARRLGRWSEAEIDGWDDQSVAALIYEPGVSTHSAGPGDSVSERAADLDAGRGVGLDLVRERVRGAGGRLELSSRSGQGTGFRLRFDL